MTGRLQKWRPAIMTILLVFCLFEIWRSSVSDVQIAKLSSLIVIFVTGVYAIFTFEILLENRRMAAAANLSARIMEQSLRFSLAPNLVFSTLVTKDPSLNEIANCRAFENDDHRRALREFLGSGETMEFVYAVIRNIGKGSATKVNVNATFKIKDTANPNETYSVDKHASLQSLDPECAVAVCVYISKVPTPDDRVDFVQAKVSSSDSYRDAVAEPLSSKAISPQDNEIRRGEACILIVN